MPGYSLMNKNENFKQFIREEFPQLDVNQMIEAFQYWVATVDSTDFRAIDLDDFENSCEVICKEANE